LQEYRERLTQAIANCDACPLGELSKQEGWKPVTFRGKAILAPKIMFIGEAPGEHEANLGLPFVGRSGQLLDRLLAQLSLVDADYYITNGLKHRPPGNRLPTKNELSACVPKFLAREIQVVQPRSIVCLGKTASNIMLSIADHGIPPRYRGYTFQYNDIPVLFTWHPAYILRNPNKYSELLGDIKQMVELL
jgi:DNA polymerase